MKDNVMKEEKSNRIKVLSVRMTPDEHAALVRKWRATTCRKLSDYARKKLAEKPIVATYRNTSLDELMGELILLRKELNNIGNNFNQAVHKLHMVDNVAELKIWLRLYDDERKHVAAKLDEIRQRINKVADVWLR